MVSSATLSTKKFVTFSCHVQIALRQRPNSKVAKRWQRPTRAITLGGNILFLLAIGAVRSGNHEMFSEKLCSSQLIRADR
jgi:hypothetical protein